MRLLMIGPPGAGKGTQAKMLARALGIPHISSGDLFREAIAAGTELGILADRYISKGDLVPDDVTLGLLKSRMSEDDCRGGYILDGFPRTLNQAKTLNAALSARGGGLDLVLEVKVPDDVLVDRLTARRSCSVCGRIYNLRDNPPPVPGKCGCGGDLTHRSDDTVEVVTRRLGVYRSQTSPLLDYYGSHGLLITLDGTGSIDEVFERLQGILQARVKS
jgi:adenylate kinase